MFNEENVKSLKETFISQRENCTKQFYSLMNEANEIKQKCDSLNESIQTLKEITQTDEIDKKIEEKQQQLDELTESHNEKYKKINEIDRKACVSDGVIQACSLILQEDRKENNDIFPIDENGFISNDYEHVEDDCGLNIPESVNDIGD